MKFIITRPRAILTADGRALIEFGYFYPGAIAELKRRVPVSDRRYDALRHRWTIAPPSAFAALAAMRYMLPDAAIDTPKGVA